jgi:hypothetical protein
MVVGVDADGRREVGGMKDDRALLEELYEWALDACHQGSGSPFQSEPTWHNFMSTWEEADELLPRVAKAIGR